MNKFIKIGLVLLFCTSLMSCITDTIHRFDVTNASSDTLFFRYQVYGDDSVYVEYTKPNMKYDIRFLYKDEYGKANPLNGLEILDYFKIIEFVKSSPDTFKINSTNIESLLSQTEYCNTTMIKYTYLIKITDEHLE